MRYEERLATSWRTHANAITLFVFESALRAHLRTHISCVRHSRLADDELYPDERFAVGDGAGGGYYFYWENSAVADQEITNLLHSP